MINFRYIFVTVVFFSKVVCCFSQTVTGKLVSEKKEVLNAVVLFKEATKIEATKEFILAKNGTFQKTLQKEYETLLIEVKAEGYSVYSYVIENPIKNKIYTLNFELKKIKVLELQEVIITGKKKPFEIKEDTISYNVSRYTDGSERKIQDVIKKLPGVEINEKSGEIKYKGKSVETVTLDGDNLFGFNYSLGTKNINVDMVEQVQAIDNYTENPLLKGIEQGGKVSLNLKLKKGKFDFSGNLRINNGWFFNDKLAFNNDLNILGINKTYKSFASLTYNNVGENRSPFDYFGFNFNFEQQKERNYLAEKIILEPKFSNLLDDSRATINNQFFSNYNAIFKINSKVNIKTNFYFLKDRLMNEQSFENQYLFDNQKFTTIDNTFIAKKPQQYRGDIELKYNASKNALLEYKIKAKNEQINTPSTTIQNGFDVFSTSLSTNDFYLKQELLWTQKLSTRKALQISVFHSINDLPQKLDFIAPVSKTQESRFKKTVFEGKVIYLGSGTNDKYSVSIGANQNFAPYFSRLYDGVQTSSINDFLYNKSSFFNEAVYNFNRDNWQISPSYSIQLLKQNLKQNTLNQEQSKNSFIVEPALKVKYKLNLNSSLVTSIGLNQNSNSEQYFFVNQVLINNRITIKNTANLEIQKSQNYALMYLNNDIENQFLFNTNVNYQVSNGNFFTNQNITENTTQFNYFYLPQSNDNWSLNTSIRKYISTIASSIKISISYNISNFRSSINNLSIWQNQNQNSSSTFFWKSAFNFPLNFENTFNFQHSEYKSESQFAFKNNGMQNKFKILLKPNKTWFLMLSSDYYIPDTRKSNEHFLFIDATLRYKPKNKKWETELTFKNLSNEKNFKQVQTSEISTSVFSSNILPAHVLLNFYWSF